MIAEFLNRDIVLDQLKQVREDLQSQIERASRKGEPVVEDDRQLLAELSAAERRERAVSSGQEGFDATHAARRGQEPAPLDDYSFFSRDPIVSLVQSSLEEYTDEHPDMVEESPPEDDGRRGPGDAAVVTSRRLINTPAPRHEDGRRIFDQFSVTDARWVKSKVAEGIRLLRGKHAFNPKPAQQVELASDARLILVGDWGSGLPRAKKVADQMRLVLDEGKKRGRQQHVVHLGDTYYSGWAKEYRKRFLPLWPVRDDEASTIGSWATNSNHDMYSGAYGYFDVLLADRRFAAQQQSSFFSFLHPNWRIVGLDTAWDEGDLHGGQLGWLEDHLEDRQRKSLLLSHHQLFSAYEKDSKTLQARLESLLERYGVNAWFWGHEHRCVFYETHERVQAARCIGHGGVPVYMWHKETDPHAEPSTYEYRRAIKSGLESWALFGFAVLDFAGPVIEVRYIDEDGREHYKERIV